MYLSISCLFSNPLLRSHEFTCRMKSKKQIKNKHNNAFYKSKKITPQTRTDDFVYGKDRFRKSHNFKSFQDGIMIHLKSENNTLYKEIMLDGQGYIRPTAPARNNKEVYKVWLNIHGKEALKRAANKAISAVLGNICSDYLSMILVTMPDIQISDKRADVRKLMSAIKAIKDEERAPNKAAKKKLVFQELINVKQESNESTPAFLKRVKDLAEELELCGQAMDEPLVASIAVKGLASKYSSISDEADRNALYASTSATGESNSGLVIKSLTDVAKACRALDVTPSLVKQHKSTWNKPRNFMADKQINVSKSRRPICFRCYNKNLEFEHMAYDCPNTKTNGKNLHVNAKRDKANAKQIHVNKRQRNQEQHQPAEESEEEQEQEDEQPAGRSVFQVLKRIKKK